MIITLTENANGQRRIYLGGKSSLEAYIEPKADNIGWTFHLEDALAGHCLADSDKHRWAAYTLEELARAVNVPPNELETVPFETIGALHTRDPYLGRRVASPKSRVIEYGFTAVCPTITKPHADFTAKTYAEFTARTEQRHR